ncbi:MAG: hypothetical protein GXO39_05040 [Thermotogae bacterium]|nr:hypothetical protein [Thermotogota bacterium]
MGLSLGELFWPTVVGLLIALPFTDKVEEVGFSLGLHYAPETGEYRVLFTPYITLFHDWNIRPVVFGRELPDFTYGGVTFIASYSYMRKEQLPDGSWLYYNLTDTVMKYEWGHRCGWQHFGLLYPLMVVAFPEHFDPSGGWEGYVGWFDRGTSCGELVYRHGFLEYSHGNPPRPPLEEWKWIK